MKYITIIFIILLLSLSFLSLTEGYIVIQRQSQQTNTWCAEASLAMVLSYWGTNVTQIEISNYIRDVLHHPDPKIYGTNPYDMALYAQSLGYNATNFISSIEGMKPYIAEGIPLIVGQWGDTLHTTGHTRVVVGFDYGLVSNFNGNIVVLSDYVCTYDPAIGFYDGVTHTEPPYNISYSEFTNLWGYIGNWTLAIQPYNITPTPIPSPSPSPIPTVTSIPTATPTPTVTPIPTATPSPSPSPTPTITLSPTPIPTVSPTPSPLPTATPTPISTPTPTPITTPTPTPSPTATPTVTPRPTPIVSPTPTTTPMPTITPTITPTATPTPTLTPTNTPIPTPISTAIPSPNPTETPIPTIEPTLEPTPSVTPIPTSKTLVVKEVIVEPTPTLTPANISTVIPIQTSVPTLDPKLSDLTSNLPIELVAGTILAIGVIFMIVVVSIYQKKKLNVFNSRIT